MEKNYSNLCRFCLNFVDVLDRIDITDSTREQFKEAINVDLKTNNYYSDFHCNQCSEELQTCLKIKEKFVKNQQILEEHFKLEDDNKTDILNFVNIKKEESLDGNEAQLEPEVEIDIKTSEEAESDDISSEIDSKRSTRRKPSKKKRRSKKYECDVDDCKKRYHSTKDLAYHKSTAHGAPEKCSVCSKTLSCGYALKRHMKTHLENYIPVKKTNCKRVPCQDCGRLFRTDNIKKHYERIHLKLRQYQCDICSRSFFSKMVLENHIKTHQNIKDEECPECNMKFNQKGSLSSHIKLIHENRYARTCHICGKVYKTKSQLDGHIRSKHTGERKYGCPIEGCDKRFFNCADMIKHKKTYHQANQICPICSAEVKHLKQHMKNHKLDFCCSLIENGQICNKRFPNNYNLQNHIDTHHRGIRKHICSLCDSAYVSRSDLQNHIRTVHEQKRIQCELCSTLITRKDYYRKHVMDNHKELDDMTKDLLLEKIKSTKDEDLFNYQK